MSGTGLLGCPVQCELLIITALPFLPGVREVPKCRARISAPPGPPQAAPGSDPQDAHSSSEPAPGPSLRAVLSHEPRWVLTHLMGWNCSKPTSHTRGRVSKVLPVPSSPSSAPLEPQGGTDPTPLLRHGGEAGAEVPQCFQTNFCICRNTTRDYLFKTSFAGIIRSYLKRA